MSIANALARADRELPLPAGETVRDGEWVVAVFEVAGLAGTTTAAAARGLRHATGDAQPSGVATNLSFERGDWERLVEFGQACGGVVLRPHPGVPAAPPTKPSLGDDGEPRPRPPPSSGEASSETAIKAPRSRGQPSSPTLSAGGGARVLLVDDEREIREVVSAMLDAVGLHVESATSAEEALERLRAQSYGLAILDWNLPGMTGIELCRVIRKDPNLLTLPVLFLTAHTAPQDVVEAFASGADDYVVKPFRAPELGARIFSLLRRARMAQSSES